MELKNDFEVEGSVEQIWEVFNDVERIAPCLPGAQLQETEGEEFKGIVKVKVGPITTQYSGVAAFQERNEAERKVVLRAEGRDTKGAGNASATISVQLHEVSPGRTKVDVDTTLSVTGKVAQFGRGVMADISAKLMDQFADNLRELLNSDSSPGDSHSDVASLKGEGPAAEPEAVDILAASSSKMVKFFGTIAGFFLKIILGIKGIFTRKKK